MAQAIEDKSERPRETFSFKEFLAVNTTNSRIACPDQAFYDLTNIQPIGSGNLHSIPAISASLANFGASAVYWDQYVNVGGVDYQIVATTDGKLFAYDIDAATVTQINGANTLSGSGTRITQWQNSQALIIDPTGYFNWDGSGDIVSIGGVTSAPAGGTDIAVYSNYVFVVSGRTLYFSAPGSFTDWTTTDGGGFRALIDSTLRSNVYRLLSANGYLYIIGANSVDALSNMYIPSGLSTPTASYTYLNLTPIIGTDQPASVSVYGRLVLFANRYGVWAMAGAEPQPISSFDPNNTYNSSIDGTWQYVNFTQPISGGQVIVNNRLCAAFLIQRANDPVFGSNTVIALYQADAGGGRWWFANYGAVTRISTGFVNNVPVLFAYIGNQLYQLFANPASTPAASLQTALWDFDDPITSKEALIAGFQITIFNLPSKFTLNIDTPGRSQPLNLLTVSNVQWVNNQNALVQWINNLEEPVLWFSRTSTLYWGSCPAGAAKYLGFSFTASAGSIFELNALLLDYKWGKRWS